MGIKKALSDYVVVKQLFAPANYGSDTYDGTCDVATNPNIQGFDHARFILNMGSIGSDDTFDVAITWASSGNATDCAEITNATDAFFTQIDTDGPNSIYLLELDFVEAGMETGVLGATFTCADSDVYAGLVVELYGGTHTSSNLSQEETVIKTY